MTNSDSSAPGDDLSRPDSIAPQNAICPICRNKAASDKARAARNRLLQTITERDGLWDEACDQIAASYALEMVDVGHTPKHIARELELIGISTKGAQEIIKGLSSGRAEGRQSETTTSPPTDGAPSAKRCLVCGATYAPKTKKASRARWTPDRVIKRERRLLLGTPLVTVVCWGILLLGAAFMSPQVGPVWRRFGYLDYFLLFLPVATFAAYLETRGRRKRLESIICARCGKRLDPNAPPNLVSRYEGEPLCQKCAKPGTP